MIEKIEGIVTDVIKHNDTHNVVTLFTRSRGRMAFLVPVGKTKSGRMRNAVLSLMAVVSADINVREGRELHTLRQVQPLRLWHAIYSHPVKGSLLFFLTEFCNRLIRQYPPDEALWAAIMEALEKLDALPSGRIANFHISFLVKLLTVTGIRPAVSEWQDGMLFDMLSGEMVDRTHPEFLRRRQLLNEKESRAVVPLLRMNYRNMALYRFTRSQRNAAINRLLGYYSIHLPLGTDFKSLPVLRDLFD